MYLIDPAGNYPRHVGDVQADNPDWDETQPLPDGWIQVQDTDLPEIPDGYTLTEKTPALDTDGIMRRVFGTRKLTKAELARLAEANDAGTN